MVSDTYTPKRAYTRREPAADAAEPQDTTQAVEPTRRRQRANLGGFSQRLAVEARPGFVRRWVNDDGSGRPERLHTDLAYDFVTDSSVKSDVAGSRIARNVGRKPTGEPMLAYLMETPETEYAVGVAEKEDRLKPFEEAISSNRDTTGQLTEADNVYAPRGGRSSLKRS